MRVSWRRWCGAAALGACVAVAGAAARAESQPDPAPAAVFDLPNPPEIRSRGGVLDATFTAAPATVTVAGRTFRSNVYNGLYIPPTLRVRRGDTLLLRLVNRIGPADVEINERQPTNIHFHGMDVSPRPPGDNVFIKVQPGDSFQYRVDVPADHPEGLHWYHAHLHTKVEAQILSGLSGMLIVDGGLQSHYPELARLRERVMVLKDVNLPGATSPTRTVNGLADPPIRSRPGELQVWAIGNVGADGYFDLKLEGHKFWVLERDGNFLLRPRLQSSLFLPPGARTLVVVQAKGPGRYYFQSQAVDTGPTGLPSPRARLGTFVVEGTPVAGGDELARRLERPAASPGSIAITGEQVRRMPVTRRRTFTFSDAPDFSAFYINGKTYNENRIDTVVRNGDVEEWTLRNTAGEAHVFHIHQTSFLVTEINGVRQDYPGLRDVINIPWQVNGRPGEVKVIIPFTNPRMVGRFVYHCHIVGHEDLGMMQNIEVLPKLPKRTDSAGLWDRLQNLAVAASPRPPAGPAAGALASRALASASAAGG